AYEKYVDMNGKHHNMYFPAGFDSLKKAMKENHEKFPEKKFSIKHVIGEGEMAIAHSHLTFNSGGKEMIVFHMFRFKNGKIVEMWDCGQEIPDDIPNKDGAF
ncbi:ester cyclase, partial [Candidatus Pacearchaeota archaeon]|nr:ester cyclase [Candidatus Pacearchaeota archaeon]